MPLKRTPPKTDSPAAAVFKTPLQHYASDTNLTETPSQEFVLSKASSLTSVTSHNSKRKRQNSSDHSSVTDELSRSEILELFSSLKEGQELKFSAILTSIHEVKVVMDSMSHKYDEVLQRLDFLEEEKKGYDNKIKFLENKVEFLERYTRGTSIEIRNIPQDSKETKEELGTILRKAAVALDVPLDSSEIRDVYRIATKSGPKTIIADFTTVSLRDKFIGGFKKCIKGNQTNKFTTTTLKISGPSQPVFISENLTQKDRRLFFLAREFARSSGYSFCWTSFGRIFMRKSEGSPHLRISCENDLAQLRDSQ